MAKAKSNTPVEEYIEGANFVLKDVPVKWAHVLEPDTKFEHAWKIDAILDKDMADSMAAAGFGVKESDDGEFSLTIKTKCKTKNGKDNRAPKVVGRDLAPFTEPIGNGSVCNIKVWAKYIEVSGKTYLPAYLDGVQVVDHVAYDASGFENLDGNAPF